MLFVPSFAARKAEHKDANAPKDNPSEDHRLFVFWRLLS